MKKILIILTIIILVVVAVYLIKNRKTDTTGTDRVESFNNSNRQGANMLGFLNNDNFTEGDLADLKIGQQITVMGQENSGGIVAERIIIGEIDWEAIRENAPREEERTQIREEMAVRRGTGTANGQRMNNNGSRAGRETARISGEIIFKDENSLTLKINDGGSKLVFISENTGVMLIGF